MFIRRSWLSQKRGRGGTQTRRCAVSISSRCQADTPVSVCDCANLELAARHSKCPKTKIHFKMFLFRIFIHRSGLIFHFINAFISYLFSFPQGILHIQMNKYRFTLCFPAVLERWAPDTLQSPRLEILLSWPIMVPDHSLMFPLSWFSLFCPKMPGWGYFFFDFEVQAFGKLYRLNLAHWFQRKGFKRMG